MVLKLMLLVEEWRRVLERESVLKVEFALMVLRRERVLVTPVGRRAVAYWLSQS